MYRFQIRAQTQAGESIAIVGSSPELGLWDLTKSVRLSTNVDLYPLWQTDTAIALQPLLAATDAATEQQKIEYKYVCFDVDGKVQWETSTGNRWVPIAPSAQASIAIDDGAFGYLQPFPFGYIDPVSPKQAANRKFDGLKIVVIGSSVAEGYKAWLMQGWVEQLSQSLREKYDHHVVNLSELGANVIRTINRFPSVVTPEQADIVIIALSLGNEGLATCAPHDRKAVQRRFESGLQQLIKMTRQLGAIPILGGVYPNNDYLSEHYWFLRDTHKRMMTWDVPVLNWLTTVDDGQGRWKEGLSFDPAHPNTRGHQLMFEAIDLSLFEIDKAKLTEKNKRFWQANEIPIYLDQAGFQITASIEAKKLRIVNPSKYDYTIAPYWQELQTALIHARLIPGLYIAKDADCGMLPFFAVRENGTIETTLPVPYDVDIEYTSAFNLFSPDNSHLLFYDGDLAIVMEDDRHFCIINESEHEFNVHPMWKEVRSAFKALPEGVYDDPNNPNAPFRTLMVGRDGLESRVKIAAKSAVFFQYKCKLNDISRVAIVPLGDRCAVRMMLYKMEYDGPAFPFDLTRTTQIADIADIIENRFANMWNPACLHYSAEAGRIYHSKWSGLSFAHEVEASDDPQNDMSPVFERMRIRYSARAERFSYTLEHSDKVLFVRTGCADRNGAIDLVEKLEKQLQGKPFHLLILSPQSSDEFLGIPNVRHFSQEFNPDRMHDDLGYWMYCTEVMRGILESMGISSKNLFWCPPNTPKRK
jgi:lysophospholipase L1-like esterase